MPRVHNPLGYGLLVMLVTGSSTVESRAEERGAQERRCVGFLAACGIHVIQYEFVRIADKIRTSQANPLETTFLGARLYCTQVLYNTCVHVPSYGSVDEKSANETDKTSQSGSRKIRLPGKCYQIRMPASATNRQGGR